MKRKFFHPISKRFGVFGLVLTVLLTMVMIVANVALSRYSNTISSTLDLNKQISAGGDEATYQKARNLTQEIAGEGASSKSFWFLFWMEHSRSPRQTTLPPSSASSCTSICLTGERYFSMYTPPSPKAFFASSDAVKNAFSNSSGPFTSRIPFPPPPARALIKTGYPILFASLAA